MLRSSSDDYIIQLFKNLSMKACNILLTRYRNILYKKTRLICQKDLKKEFICGTINYQQNVNKNVSNINSILMGRMFLPHSRKLRLLVLFLVYLYRILGNRQRSVFFYFILMFKHKLYINILKRRKGKGEQK